MVRLLASSTYSSGVLGVLGVGGTQHDRHVGLLESGMPFARHAFGNEVFLYEGGMALPFEQGTAVGAKRREVYALDEEVASDVIQCPRRTGMRIEAAHAEALAYSQSSHPKLMKLLGGVSRWPKPFAQEKSAA